MDIYLFPIQAAILTFLAMATALTSLYIIIQYRKYGSVSTYRTLIMISFILYLLTAYYLVILPLPDPQVLQDTPATAPYFNLIPFRFVYYFIMETSFRLSDVCTFLPALSEGAFIEPFFNVVLTIPFGIYLAYYFKLNVKKIVLFSFLFSLFFELSQLTALYGFYARPYRLADVNDLMLNTLGGFIGFVFYKRFLSGFLPSKDQLDVRSLEKSHQVGYFRRCVAFIIDYSIVAFMVNFLTSRILFLSNNQLLSVISFHFLLTSYFLLLHALFKMTIGQKLVNIKVVSTG